jgi:autotransporter translocation and assembly factor TamB
MQEIDAPPGRGRPALRFLGFAAVFILVAVAAGVVVFRNGAALAVLRSVAHGFGYDVTAGNLDVNAAEAIARDVRIRNAAGEPVLEATRIDVGYSLRDLLPGGKRLYGLTSLDVETPHLTLVHHRDGTYNITIPPTPSKSPAPNAVPLDVRLRVTNGTADLVDQFVSAPRERRARLSAVHAEGAISPAAASYYHAGAVLEDGAARYPIAGNARFEDPRGLEVQHWTAARLPLALLANFMLSTHAIVIQGGEIRGLDLTLGALSTPSGTMQSHLGVTAELADGRVAVAALAKPIRDAHGTFVVDGDSATVRSLDAALNGIPLHVSGALYQFAAPQVAFALTARGDLSRMRGLSKDSAKLPLGGAVALQGLAEGPAANPLIFVRVNSPRIDYGAYRLDGARGFAAISGKELDVIAAAVRYGPVALAGRASLQLAQHTQTAGYALLSAPANSLPYVENLVPGMPLRAVAVANGTDARLAVRGYLAGTSGSDRLDAPFAIDASGSGTVGPLVLQRRDGASVYARAAIDRQTGQTAAVVDVRHLALLPAPAAKLPGLVVPALPSHLDAKLDATFTGIASGTSLVSANGVLHGYGAWGDLRADADGSGSRLAARGRLTTSFERLAPFTGNLGARGGIDVPFALSKAGRATILQISNARFPGASIRGLALQRADATLGLALPAVDIYSADLRIAGHDVTAAGRFGNGGQVRVTAGDLDLAALRAAGVPISGGRATVIADLGGSAAKPTASVLAALAGARYAGTDLGGDVGLAYDGAAVQIRSATLTFGGAYANATGAVAGLTLGHIAPRYNIHAQLADADIATLAHTVKNPLRYPEGTLEADVRLGGAGATPSVSGEIRVPEGSLNGLNFNSGRIGLSGTAAALTARDGRLTVGSTTLDFGGSASRAHQSVMLRADRLDLSDFNDYFDEAEVLAGTGSVALAFDSTPRALNTSANLVLRDARYRRFDLGSVDARVNTVGTTVRLQTALAGTNGRLSAAGSVNVPATKPLRDIVRRSYLDLNVQIAGLDLGNVLPAAGVSAPIFGFVDGTAVVRGRYPALALSTHAALTHGVAGRVPIERFTLAATAANGRGRLTDATLVARGLTANVSGTFGLRPQDAFDLTAQASSPDINDLITVVTGKSPAVKGTVATRAHVTGTAAAPRLNGSFDARDVSYSSVTIPSAHADLAATRQAADVRNGSITLPRGGSIAFDGHVPFGGGTSTPIALDFAPHHVDVNPYSPLLPDGSVIDGLFDGNVGVRGTLAAPRLNGSLAFTNGSFRSNSFKNALTRITLELDFAGTAVRIAKLHARAAPGNIDGSGRLALRDLRDPIRGLTVNANVSVGGAYIAAPKYYTGYVDGKISAKKRVAAPLTVGGDLSFSNARIPYTALLPSGGSSTTAAPALPNIAFNLGVNVKRDVRVQSGPVDIGTTGTARLGGTLAKPTLNGQFTATDGTVSLYRTFTVQNGSAVSFNPADGITPAVDATAVTNVPDPPTDVLLHVTGLSTHLHLAFSSQPSYSQEQILGLLVNAQALGAVSGVAQTGGTSSGGPSIAGIGEGLLNTQLTQKFLQPFSSALGGALGLSNLNLNYNMNGAVSATARRRIGKNISFTYGEQIGGPTPRTSVGINIGNDVSGAQLTFYQAAGSSQAFGGQALTPYLQSGFLATRPPNYTLEAIEPPTGSGFVFSYQRRFW